MTTSDSRLPSSFTHREILIIFSGLMTGLLLAALDQTIVATALPTIVGELGGLDYYSWVVHLLSLERDGVDADFWKGQRPVRSAHRLSCRHPGFLGRLAARGHSSGDAAADSLPVHPGDGALGG